MANETADEHLSRLRPGAPTRIPRLPRMLPNPGMDWLAGRVEDEVCKEKLAGMES